MPISISMLSDVPHGPVLKSTPEKLTLTGNLSVDSQITSVRLFVTENAYAANIAGNGFGLYSLNASNVTSGTLQVQYGGTGLNDITATRLLVGNGTNPVSTPSELVWNSLTNVFSVTGEVSATTFSGNGAALTDISASSISGIISVQNGGTGSGTFTEGHLLVGNGTNAFLTDSDLQWVTGNNTLVVTGSVSASFIIGDGSGLTNLNASNVTSGTLAVSRGGTGVSSLSPNKLLVSNAAGDGVLTPSQLEWDNGKLTVDGSIEVTTTGQFIGNGYGLTSLNLANVTGVLEVSNGGTLRDTLDQDRLLVGNATSAVLTPSQLTWNSTTFTLGVNGNITANSITADTLTLSGDLILDDITANSITSNVVTCGALNTNVAYVPLAMISAKVQFGNLEDSLSSGNTHIINRVAKVLYGSIDMANNDSITVTHNLNKSPHKYVVSTQLCDLGLSDNLITLMVANKGLDSFVIKCIPYNDSNTCIVDFSVTELDI